MKILITGCSGFLGTYLRKNFQNSKYNFLYGTTSRELSGRNVLKFDPEYKNILDNDLGIDAIIHCASVIPTNFEYSSFNTFNANNRMMNALYEYSIRFNISKFVYISGFGSMMNPRELDVRDFYTASKITGELFSSMLSTQEIDAVSFRISSPYGEYFRGNNVIKKFTDMAIKNRTINVYGTGKREQNFTYAGDVLQAIKLVLKKNISGTFNIVSDRNTSMLDLAYMIKKITKSKSEIVTNLVEDSQEEYRPKYSLTRASEAFGYKPTYTLEIGLRNFIEWYTRK